MVLIANIGFLEVALTTVGLRLVAMDMSLVLVVRDQQIMRYFCTFLSTEQSSLVLAKIVYNSETVVYKCTTRVFFVEECVLEWFYLQQPLTCSFSCYRICVNSWLMDKGA